MGRNRLTGFTLIELMIALSVSLFVIGTFLRFFSHTVRIEANNNIKGNITLKGQHLLDTVEGAVRLAGLGNTSTQYKTGAVIAAAQGLAQSVSAGNTFSGDFTFTFESPYGGPVTKVLTAQGSLPACTITLQSSASLYNGLFTLLLINRSDIYQGTLGALSGNQITTTALTPSVVGLTACGDAFPAGTLVTGPNRVYSLTTTYALLPACSGCVTLTETTVGATTVLFSIPRTEMPFFALQFLTETDTAGVITRAWVTTINDCNTPLVPGTPNICSTIKAVRFGFVLTAKTEREGGAADSNFQYCLFDSGYCFNAPANTNRRYAAFSRTVYLRNIDSLKRNLLDY